ncbi:MAG: biotin/lipoyl-containing protein, partial [Gammaproteobacteria bacterium]
MTVETVRVPDLGGAEEVEVIEISVAVGDRVEVDQTLLVLESEKATMELPSPVAGVIAR